MTSQHQNNTGNLLGDDKPQQPINLYASNKNTNNDDFNTMQNMFSTMQVQGSVNNNLQGINFFDPPKPTTNMVQTNYTTNTNDFNSLQNLFATQQNVQFQQTFNQPIQMNPNVNLSNDSFNLSKTKSF